MSDLIPDPDSFSDPFKQPLSRAADNRAANDLGQDTESATTRSERTPEQEAQRQALKRLYIMLILGGLAVGGVVSLVLVKVLQYFGLTQGPGS